MAAATPYLLNYGYSKIEGKRYFKYYETLTLVIDGKEYSAIVLDSCGAAMKRDIIDLFVSNSRSSITTNISIK